MDSQRNQIMLGYDQNKNSPQTELNSPDFIIDWNAPNG